MNVPDPNGASPRVPPSPARASRRFLILASAGLVVLTSLPFLFGFLAAPAGTTYTGIHKLTPGDFPVYFSYIEQARSGQLLFRDLYTSEPQQANLFFPFWWILGSVGRALPFLSAPFLFQLARVALIPVLLWQIFSLISRVTANERSRRALLLFVVFASGIGAFIAPAIEPRFSVDAVRGVIEWPMDLWVPEAFTFLGFLNSPHVLAAEALLLGLVLAVLASIERRGVRWPLLAGLCAAGALLIHPFLVYPIVGFLGVLTFLRLLRRQSVRPFLPAAIAVVLLSLPVVAYDAWLANDPLFQARQLQNVLRFPSLDVTLASYGLLLPFALVGFVKLARRLNEWPVLLLTAWFVGQGATLLVPFEFVRRLTEGFHVPLAILAGIGFLSFLRSLKTESIRWVTAGVLIVLLSTSAITVYLQDFLYFTENQSVVNRPRAVVEAYAWLRLHASPSDVTLTDSLNGVFLPGFAARTTYLGHDVETINSAQKRAALDAYLTGELNEVERATFLQEAGITYVLDTRETRALRTIDLDLEPSLELVWRFGPEATLYRVTADN